MIHKVSKEFSVRLLSALFSLSMMTGCQQAYYASLEKVGYHKRDIMVERVEDTAHAQQQASDEFKSALKTFEAFTQFNGGELEIMYQQIHAHYLESQTAVNNIEAKIAGVEDVANALFLEWQEELTLYTSEKLRKESEKKNCTPHVTT